MKFVKFSYEKHFKERHTQESSSDYKLQMLGVFLSDEVGSDEKTYKEWALDPEETYACGNLVFLDKKNDTIFMTYDPIMDTTEEQKASWWLTKDPINSDDPLLIPQKEFLAIIDGWIKYKKQKCKEIWIKNEGDQYWIEGIR